MDNTELKKQLMTKVGLLMSDNNLDEDEVGVVLDEIAALTPCPHITDYIYWDNLRPEEVVEKILAYTPTLLPGSDAEYEKSTTQ